MNKWIITITLVIVIGLISGVTTYKVVTTYQSNLIKVEEKYLIEQAKACINEKKCTENKITLKTLYDFEYIDKEVNPVTKEYYSLDSYIEYKDGTYSFYN